MNERNNRFTVYGLRFTVEHHLFRLILLFILNFYFLIFNCAAQSLSADAGDDTGVCQGGDSITIGGNPSATGGNPSYTYSWQPSTGLDFPNSSNPKCFISSPTNYTLTVSDASGNFSVDVVNVTIFSPPIVSAGPNQTIIEGTNTQLFASGAVNYYWNPTQTLYNPNTRGSGPWGTPLPRGSSSSGRKS